MLPYRYDEQKPLGHQVSEEESNHTYETNVPHVLWLKSMQQVKMGIQYMLQYINHYIFGKIFVKCMTFVPKCKHVE